MRFLFPECKQSRNVRFLAVILMFVFLVCLLFQPFYFGNFRSWDWMLLSFFAASIPCLLISTNLKPWFDEALKQLEDKCIVNRSLKEIDSQINNIIEKYASISFFAVLGSSIFSLIWYIVISEKMKERRIEIDLLQLEIFYSHADCEPYYCGSAGILQFGLLFLLTIVASYAIGARLGTAAGLGIATVRLIKSGYVNNIQPNHPDGASGFSSLGEYFKRQSLLLLIPIFWLSMWWLLVPYFDGREVGNSADAYELQNYVDWQVGFFAVWLLAIVFMLVGFYLPLYFIHRIMVKKKNLLIFRRVPKIRKYLKLELEALSNASVAEPWCISRIQQRMENGSFLKQMIVDLHGAAVWPLSTRDHLNFLRRILSIIFFPLILDYFNNGFATVEVLIEKLSNYL